jgi:hypothetical protein
MTQKKPLYPADKTAPQRRDGLTPAQIRDLELAGGVEGGMQAGSGGPDGDQDGEAANEDSSGKDRNCDEPA